MSNAENFDLPMPTKGACWYQEKSQPTERFLLEVYYLKELFVPKKLRPIKLVETRWDTNRINIKSLSLIPSETHDPNFPLVMDIRFSMLDGVNKICRPDQVFTMKIFTPRSYPFYAPVVSFLDENGKIVWPSGHVLNHIIINNVSYPNACKDQHNSDEFLGHDPAHTTLAMHALRGILWLRACLYSKKYGVSMPDYS